MGLYSRVDVCVQEWQIFRWLTDGYFCIPQLIHISTCSVQLMWYQKYVNKQWKSLAFHNSYVKCSVNFLSILLRLSNQTYRYAPQVKFDTTALSLY